MIWSSFAHIPAIWLMLFVFRFLYVMCCVSWICFVWIASDSWPDRQICIYGLKLNRPTRTISTQSTQIHRLKYGNFQFTFRLVTISKFFPNSTIQENWEFVVIRLSKYHCSYKSLFWNSQQLFQRIEHSWPESSWWPFVVFVLHV